MRYSLLFSLVESKVYVSVSIDYSADDVSLLVIQILNNIWAVGGQVDNILLLEGGFKLA